MWFQIIVAYVFISLTTCFASLAQEHTDLEQGDFDDYYPQLIKKFSVRKDIYSKEPVTRGRIELVGGLGDQFTFRKTEILEPNDPKGLPKRNYKRIHVDELKRLLQCSPREPTIDGSRGSMGLLQMITPRKETIEHICASIESGCTPFYKCRDEAAKFRKGKFPTGHGYDGNSNRNLIRVMNDDVYLDWPWGRQRLKNDPYWYCYNLPHIYPSMTVLLFHLLDKAFGLPDSVFIMAAEQSFFDWNVPFPALSNSPSFKSADMPWPWVESLRMEMKLHQAVVGSANRNFSGHSYHSRFTPQIEWSARIPKALYLGEMIRIRQLVFDQALRRPDLIEARWKCEFCQFEPWNPISQEDKDTVYTRIKEWWQIGQKQQGAAYDSSDAGNMLPLMKLYTNRSLSYEYGNYKYLIVLTGVEAKASSGRLATFLAHSGAVILLQESEFSYHFSARLKPWVHYVPLSYSAADLTEKILWLKKHDDLAQKIARNARSFGDSYLRLEDQFCYAATLMQKLGQVLNGSEALKPFHPRKVATPPYFS